MEELTRDRALKPLKTLFNVSTGKEKNVIRLN